MWCVAHRLELAVKDALKSTFFSTIDDMLLRIYYVYSKAPKKCRELEEVIADLSGCLDSSEFTAKGETRPIRACGTRFITHKVAALGRIIDKFGAYLSHLTALVEEPCTRPADKQKLKGYITKWSESKVLLGCATFHDILKPIAILCKLLQSDELCTVGAIEALLKSSKAIEKLKDMELTEFP